MLAKRLISFVEKIIATLLVLLIWAIILPSFRMNPEDYVLPILAYILPLLWSILITGLPLSLIFGLWSPKRISKNIGWSILILMTILVIL